MNKPSRFDDDPKAQPDDSPAASTNLVLIYSLIALGLLTAIGFAVAIVMPFYHRR